MATYSSERKADILQRLEDTEDLTVSQPAKEEVISKSTLLGWVKQSTKEKPSVITNLSIKNGLRKRNSVSL